ncbi:S8/S53 family peptidase [Ruegeria sp. R14_0]|uniref:S8/S53 family peptidase n=1 Tax=Ruegeria sp. R14_0 TaxID=2821100 RepID=UPI001ADA82D6|nr:S8/S53 family peptidase [Ruegeria sp. R14_0]MBO9448552.1 S8/S53 family peptidase [Ruegeria sp. R14_0]
MLHFRISKIVFVYSGALLLSSQYATSAGYDAVFSYGSEGLSEAEIALLATGVARVPVEHPEDVPREDAISNYCSNPVDGWMDAVELILEEGNQTLLLPPCLPAQETGYILDYAADFLDVRAAYQADSAGFEDFAVQHAAPQVSADQVDISQFATPEILPDAFVFGYEFWLRSLLAQSENSFEHRSFEPPSVGWIYGDKVWEQVTAANEAGGITDNAASTLFNRSIADVASVEALQPSELSNYLDGFFGFEVGQFQNDLIPDVGLEVEQPLFGGYTNNSGAVLYRPVGRGLLAETMPRQDFSQGIGQGQASGWLGYPGETPGTIRIEVGEAEQIQQVLDSYDVAGFQPRQPIAPVTFPSAVEGASSYLSGLQAAEPNVLFDAPNETVEDSETVSFSNGLYWRPTTLKSIEVSLQIDPNLTVEDVRKTISDHTPGGFDESGIEIKGNLEHFGELSGEFCENGDEDFWNFDFDSFNAERERQLLLLPEGEVPSPIGIAVLDFGAPEDVTEEKLKRLPFKIEPSAKGYFDDDEIKLGLNSHGVSVASVAAGQRWLPIESEVFVEVFDLLEKPRVGQGRRIHQKRLSDVLLDSQNLAVTVMSFGMSLTNEDLSNRLKNAISRHSDQIIVLAAGNGKNQGVNRVGSSINAIARYPHVGEIGLDEGRNRLVVAGLEAPDKLAMWSDFDTEDSVMLAAQGCNVPSIGFDQNSGDFVAKSSNGTSFSAPFVARIAAEMASLIPARHRDRDVRNRLVATGKIFSEKIGLKTHIISVVDPTAAIAVRSLLLDIQERERLFGTEEVKLKPSSFCELDNNVQIHDLHDLMRVHRPSSDGKEFLIITKDGGGKLNIFECAAKLDVMFFDGIKEIQDQPINISEINDVYLPLTK